MRAGTGGDEAALFAVIYLACINAVSARGGGLRLWKSRDRHWWLQRSDRNDISQDVFARLKFESGVHRVQRVPETETGGRIHTSAATVAVLPEVEDVDIDINENDLR